MELTKTYKWLTKAALFAGLALALSLGSHTVQAQEAQFAEKVNDERPEADEMALGVSAGGVFSSGNTRAWQLNAGADFKMIKGRHGLSANLAFNYGRARLQVQDATSGATSLAAFAETVKNLNAGARYDFYLTDMDALFLALKFRWDTFAGLDARVSVQAGYLRNFYKVENHRLWGEIGYDFTYDNFDPDPLPMNADGTTPEGTAVIHAGRAYVGYNNALRENVQFSAGVEFLINFNKYNAVDAFKDIRLNFDAALRSTIVERLQIELKFKLLYDAVPAPGGLAGTGWEPEELDGNNFIRSNVDTTTTVSIIYNLI